MATHVEGAWQLTHGAADRLWFGFSAKVFTSASAANRALSLDLLTCCAQFSAFNLAIHVLALMETRHPCSMAAWVQKEKAMLNNRNWTMNNGLSTRFLAAVTVYLRVALGIGFLSAVADRFGLWGPPGRPSVAWGNFNNFLTYTAKLNPWFPATWIPTIGWIATLCEICFGIALIVGYGTRIAAILSGLLTLVFAMSMVLSVGIHAALAYSVFAVSAGAFLLAGAERYPWTLDNWRRKRASSVLSTAGHEHKMLRDGSGAGRRGARMRSGGGFH